MSIGARIKSCAAWARNTIRNIWSKIMTSLASGIVSARDFLRDAHEELIAALGNRHIS